MRVERGEFATIWRVFRWGRSTSRLGRALDVRLNEFTSAIERGRLREVEEPNYFVGYRASPGGENPEICQVFRGEGGHSQPG